jgi:hypothetical protein
MGVKRYVDSVYLDMKNIVYPYRREIRGGCEGLVMVW